MVWFLVNASFGVRKTTLSVDFWLSSNLYNHHLVYHSEVSIFWTMINAIRFMKLGRDLETQQLCLLGRSPHLSGVGLAQMLSCDRQK